MSRERRSCHRVSRRRRRAFFAVSPPRTGAARSQAYLRIRRVRGQTRRGHGQARIRAVLDRLDRELTQKEQERPEPAPAAMQGRRLGGGSLEAKLIHAYGPYLYYRFREGGRHRSVYVGKARSSS
jgi:hypothetical protein